MVIGETPHVFLIIGGASGVWNATLSTGGLIVLQVVPWCAGLGRALYHCP